MIQQEKMYCSEKNMEVDVLVDEKPRSTTIAACNNMLYCEATTFCRFVNPLTTRNPLQKLEDTAEIEV